MRRSAPLLLSAALLALAAACGDDASSGPQPVPYQDDGKLTVMTRNLYLGADLNPVIQAGTDPTAFVNATTTVWNRVQANDFNARAERIADEIAATLPDLVGLQEVSLWRTQSPGDAASGNFTPNATTVAIDYLAILLSKLSARGLTYGAAETLDLFDVEVPIATGQDVRLTDRQVILAREGVPVTNPRGQVFTGLLPLPVAGQSLPVKRGWTAVQATIGGQPITFFDTHLEAFDDTARDAQAAELAAVLAGETGRVVLVGDLNSTPGTGGHLAATTAGFTDVWATVGAGSGFTCCFAGDLAQPRAVQDLTERIDHVLVRGATGQLAPVSADVVGEADADRTASGLWPSDHAGVVATITP